MNKNKTIWLLFLIFFLEFGNELTCGVETTGIKTRQLLERYRQSLSWQESVAMDIDIVFGGKIDDKKTPITERHFIFRRDNNRAEWLGELIELDDKGKIDLTKSHVIKTFMTGDTFANLSGLLRTRPLGITMTNDDEFYKNQLATRLDSPIDGGPLWGKMWGSNHKNIADLLINSTQVQLRKGKESINGILCYAIEAPTEYGKVTVWIAPEKGYNAVKWSIQKKPGDLFDEKPISSDSWIATFVVDDLQKIGNVFVTSGGQMTLKIDFGDEYERDKKRSTYKYTVRNIQLKPDFESLGAFKLDFPEGTPVQIIESPGIRYVWQNGKAVRRR
ncbi:MAG: hypothetical protein ACYSW3_09725 [Planctomycetota bacterium]|jgi:hypothetical protein